VTRKALRDYTFSDGTFVPKGATISAAATPIHYDEAFYPNAARFEPFRFVDASEGGGENGSKSRFVSTANEFLPFGHGKHAWYGNF
jgi:cytochrome P450